MDTWKPLATNCVTCLQQGAVRLKPSQPRRQPLNDVDAKPREHSDENSLRLLDVRGTTAMIPACIET